MKHSLKHKLAMFGILVGLLAFSAVPIASASPSSYLEGDAIKCASTETPIVTGGQAKPHSCCPKTVKNKTATNCLFGKYLNPVINLFSAAVGVVAVIGIIVGAIQFSSSAGDPQKAANGKNHIRNALFGLLAYILLYTFLQFLVPGGLLNG
jgi:hypothetical protein